VTPSTSAPRLLVTSGVARLDPRGLQTFVEAGFRLEYRYDLSGVRDPEQVLTAVDGVWGVLAGTVHYGREVLDAASSLRVIARCGVGYDAIDVPAARDNGVTVVTTPGTNDASVAEFAVGLILASTVLREDPVPLCGETVAVVGLGAIGLRVAARLAGFGCRILGVDPVADPAECARAGIELGPLDAALCRAGVVTVHAPLNDHTRGMIGRRELDLMPSDAVLVNTARGGVVDEAALAAALTSGRLRAAALDVFADEPLPVIHPLRETPSTLLAGHIAGMTLSSVMAMLDGALAGLCDVRDGRAQVRGAMVDVAAEALPATVTS
jgi:phosphoglycerate dehydrogenase-like enzyme